jgi:predicted acyltransferase
MAQAQTAKQRLLSLDFFRGVTVAAMILVNNPGDWGNIYAPLEHSKWNGCTPTDLVFPFFLFIVGVSIVFAMGSKKADPAIHTKAILKALRRSITIFALALFFSLMPKFDFSTVRIMGVLPRIAIVFFISTVLYIKLTRKALVWIFAIILLVYYILMNFVPVPGFGPSNLEPGTNLAAWLDRIILTENHLWNQTKTWDPESILSTLPAISTCLFGVLAGIWLQRKDRTDAEKVSWMFSIAAISIVAGLVWDGFFPMNKALWTSSFVLYVGGLALAAFTLCYWFIDVQGHKKFTKPFVVYGANAITVYIVSGYLPWLLDFVKVPYKGKSVGILSALYNGVFMPNFSPVNASLVWAILYVLIFMPPLWLMYNKKIFIKI